MCGHNECGAHIMPCSRSVYWLDGPAKEVVTDYLSYKELGEHLSEVCAGRNPYMLPIVYDAEPDIECGSKHENSSSEGKEGAVVAVSADPTNTHQGHGKHGTLDDVGQAPQKSQESPL